MKEKRYLIKIYENLIYIENYICIEEISSIQIKIKLINKLINIKGDDLLINRLDEYDLSICGEIKRIEFINE